MSDRSVPSPLKTWLFVLPWTLDSIGGVSEVVRNLMRQVDESGLFASGLHVLNRVQIVEGGSDKSHRTAALIHFREPFGPIESPYRCIAFFLCLIPTLLRLRRRLLVTRVSVVNIHYPGLAAFYFAVARRLHWIDKLVLSFHGADVTALRAEVGFRARTFRWLCRSADALIACSTSLATKVDAVLDLGQGHVAVVHNGLDEQACLADMRSSEPVVSDSEVVLCVASLEHKKGIDVLIDAFALFSRHHPLCRLVVVGRETTYMEQLLLQIRELVSQRSDLAARIDIIQGESHGRILQRMKAARIVALPSREEPFGIVLLESGFVGVPVVATRVGGIPEIVEHEVSGLLVPSDDKSALAQACDRLLKDAELRAQLATALAQRVRDHFTWTAAWHQYVALTSTKQSRPFR